MLIENGHESPNECVLTYIPENLDLDAVPAAWRDYAAWVVGGLYVRRHTEKYLDPDDFRRTSSVVLKQVLPKRDYVKILDALVGACVIEREKGYWATRLGRPGWSKGCRLTPAYKDARFRRVLLDHRELVRKVAKLREKEEVRFPADVHRHLRDALRRLELAPDAPDVLSLAVIDDGFNQILIFGVDRRMFTTTKPVL